MRALKKETFVSNSPEETFSKIEALAANSKSGGVYALYGDLGAGKTIAAKAIASALKVADTVTSPTFTLMEAYSGTMPVYHFDLYRIESDAELDNLFFEEYWEGDGVSVIEWAEKAEHRLPERTIKIHIDYLNENARRITVEYPDI